MKKIIETLLADFPDCAEHQHVYDFFFTTFHRKKVTETQATILANIAFLFSYRPAIDYLLAHIEKDVARLWEEEKLDRNSWLNLHTPRKQDFKRYFGLLWPVPSKGLASNRSRHLLSRVLLAMEQKHQVNVGKGDNTIPTFVGYINPKEAFAVLRAGYIWNDEAKIDPLFFHGKMTHRIMLNVLLRAYELNLIDLSSLGAMPIPALLTLLTRIEIENPSKNMAWDYLFDFVITSNNVLSRRYRDMEGYKPLLANHAPQISHEGYDSPYFYGSDPYFVNSYLMTVSRANTPYLSECVTQMFCKSGLAIQVMEKELRYTYHLPDYYFRLSKAEQDKTPQFVKLEDNDLTIDKIMQRHAYSYPVAGYTPVMAEDVLLARCNKKGESPNYPANINSHGIIQFYSLFTTTKKPDDVIEQGSTKRRRAMLPSASAPG